MMAWDWIVGAVLAIAIAALCVDALFEVTEQE